MPTIDDVYLERNQVVAGFAAIALRAGWNTGIRKTAIEGWEPEWHNCVYIDLPTGQASWHYHDEQSYLFDFLPPYDGEWDGHDTPEKYERLLSLRNNKMDESDINNLNVESLSFARAMKADDCRAWTPVDLAKRLLKDLERKDTIQPSMIYVAMMSDVQDSNKVDLSFYACGGSMTELIGLLARHSHKMLNHE